MLAERAVLAARQPHVAVMGCWAPGILCTYFAQTRRGYDALALCTFSCVLGWGDCQGRREKVVDPSLPYTYLWNGVTFCVVHATATESLL